MISATNNGHRRRGNTFPIIMKNSVRKSSPACGSTRVRKPGAKRETIRLHRTIYVTSPLNEPPSFCTITADAVAVGQMKHSMAPSQRSFREECVSPMPGKRHDRNSDRCSDCNARRENKTNNAPCVRSRMPCHRCGFRLRGSTFKNDSRSIAKMSAG